MGELAKSTIPVSSFRSCLTNPHSPPNNERSHSLTMYNNSERPVDALALILEKHQWLTHWLTYNFKSKDASASKKTRKNDQHDHHFQHFASSYVLIWPLLLWSVVGGRSLFFILKRPGKKSPFYAYCRVVNYVLIWPPLLLWSVVGGRSRR